MLAINIPRHKTKPLGRHATAMGGCWVQSPLTFNPTLASSSMLAKVIFVDTYIDFGSKYTKHRYNINCLLKTLKQIFRLESIPCVCLHNILNRLLVKVCLVVLFMCLYPFVAFVSLSTFKLLNVTLWLAVTHAYKGNGPKFAQ